MKNLQWPSEKELILYKIFLNKEITDWQKYGRKTLEEGVGKWVFIPNDRTDKRYPLGCGFQTSLVWNGAYILPY